MPVNGIVGAKYLLTQLGTPYAVRDCINAVVVDVIRKCPGGDKDYRIGGCTALWNSIDMSQMYRDCTARIPINQAMREGLLVGDLPVIVDGDTCEHIAYYMGGVGGYECVHSSATRGELCGTTLKNGFTHVLRHRYITGVPADAGAEKIEEKSMDILYNVIIATQSGPLNMRSKASSSADIITTIPKGVTVGVVEETSSKWLRIIYGGQTGYVSRPLTAKAPPVDAGNEKPIEPNGGATWGVFVPCGSEAAANALADYFGVALVCQREVAD